MGGVGKTELALQYAQRYQKHYPGSRCWLSARGESLVTQIIEFARSFLMIYIPDELSDKAKLNYCWQHWGSESSLIVVDNMPDDGKFYQETIAPYLLSAPSNIKMLITSRERPGQNISCIDLDVLTEPQALELLASFISEPRIKAEPESANELCKRLGYLPLGLELVGRYIALDETLTIEKILKQLEQKKLKARALLNRQQADMTAQVGVATAFDLYWDVLSTEARKLGCYLSLLASEPFKWSWVETAWIESTDEEERKEQVEDLKDLRDMELTKRNLLKVVSDNYNPLEYNFQLHSLIAQYFRAKLEEQPEATELKKQFCRVMNQIAQTIPHKPTLEEIQAVNIVIPHLSTVATELTEYIDDEDLVESYAGLGKFYQGQGIYNQAEQWFEQCLEVCRERLGEQHFQIATSLNNLANLYLSQGRYEDAEPLLLQSRKLLEQALGERHSDVAASLNNLAELYRLQGRYEDAEPLLLQSLELLKQHPERATSLNNLALLYLEQRRYNEAEPLFRKSLELRRQLLEKQPIDVAVSLNNLAELYRVQRQYSKAEPLLVESLELKTKLLGTQHPSVALSFNNLALLYLEQRRYDEAEPFLLKALELRREFLEEQHPDVAQSLNNLALLYLERGRYNEAKPRFLEALTIAEKVLGKNHADTNTFRDNLKSATMMEYLSMSEAEMREVLPEETCEQLLDFKKFLESKS